MEVNSGGKITAKPEILGSATTKYIHSTAHRYTHLPALPPRNTRGCHTMQPHKTKYFSSCAVYTSLRRSLCTFRTHAHTQYFSLPTRLLWITNVTHLRQTAEGKLPASLAQDCQLNPFKQSQSEGSSCAA